MPELPEVETVRLGIEHLFAGHRIDAVRVFDERSLKRHPGDSQDFTQTLIGAHLGQPQRRGKFLWIPLELAGASSVESAPPPALLAHLGMSGQLLAHDLSADAPPLRHERIRIDTVDESGRHRELSFHDQRLFGSLAVDTLVADRFALHGLVPRQAAHIAPDPLEAGFDRARLARSIRRHRSAVKRVLLDQTTVSGIGNIYADESLWAARVHPEQPADSLSQACALRLVDAVVAVLRRAVAVGGTSFDEQYKHVNGESGYFVIELSAYGQTGQPCPRCGRPIKRVAFMNRHSHLCTYCQRLR